MIKYTTDFLSRKGNFSMIINKQPQRVTDVIATMAIEDMYLSREFVDELVKVANGKRTSESLRQEVIKKYARS